MATLKEAEIIEKAAAQELQLARKRILELEGNIRELSSRGRGIAWVVRVALGLAVACLGVIAAAAASHRVLLWGWPQ